MPLQPWATIEGHKMLLECKPCKVISFHGLHDDISTLKHCPHCNGIRWISKLIMKGELESGDCVAFDRVLNELTGHI